MRQHQCSRGVLILALFGLLSTSAFGAKVGYYEMCDGQGGSWAIAPISAAGHTPVFLSDLRAVDLQGLDAVFVTNCHNRVYAAEYMSRRPDIDLAVQNGLVLMMHDRRVDLARTILPGGSSIEFIRYLNSNIDVADDSTVLTNGPGGVISNTTLNEGRYANHGHALAGSLPPNTAIILTQPNAAEVVVFSYPYGKGSVVYSSVPIDRYLKYAPVCTRFTPGTIMRRLCLNVIKIYSPNIVAYGAQLLNTKPKAVAGADLSGDEDSGMTLDGSASHGHGELSYQWQQLSPVSPVIQLNAASVTPGFVAPTVAMNTTFTLQLVVTDQKGKISDPDTVDITVKNLNTAPVADAGDDFAIKAGATASLDGSHSYDADGDEPLLYSWVQVSGPTVSLQSPDSIKPTFSVPNAIGQQLIFDLTLHDGQEMSLASRVTVSIVDNAAPIADAGFDQTRDEGNIVPLTAIASFDPDQDGMIFNWSQLEGPKVELDNTGSPTPHFTAPRVAAGGAAILFKVTVTDIDPLNPKSSVDLMVVNVRNINDPPACNLARPSVASLWPPNHTMRPISIVGVSDTDSLYNDVAIIINSVSMDEAVSGHGSGHSSPDAVIQSMQPADNVLLRAERKRHSNGRVYQVNFTASDGFESCTGQVQVTVPLSRKRAKAFCDDDRGKHKGRKHADKGRKHAKQCQAALPVDDGQNYDATDVAQQSKHDIKEKLEKKLAKLKAGGGKHKDRKHKDRKHNKNRKHDKNRKHKDADD